MGIKRKGICLDKVSINLSCFSKIIFYNLNAVLFADNIES